MRLHIIRECRQSGGQDALDWNRHRTWRAYLVVESKVFRQVCVGSSVALEVASITSHKQLLCEPLAALDQSLNVIAARFYFLVVSKGLYDDRASLFPIDLIGSTYSKKSPKRVLWVSRHNFKYDILQKLIHFKVWMSDPSNDLRQRSVEHVGRHLADILVESNMQLFKVLFPKVGDFGNKVSRVSIFSIDWLVDLSS